jgi:hypothetical protein
MEAFAGGEILVAAMEKVALTAGANGIYNSTLMAETIRDGSWSTILAKDNVTFSTDTHQAITKWLFAQLQPGTNSGERKIKLIQSSTELVYPMPTWDQRTEATSCAATTSFSDDDRTTAEITLDIAIAVLSLLVIFLFAFIGYTIYFTCFVGSVANKQLIGSDGKWTSTSGSSSSSKPMAKSEDL